MGSDYLKGGGDPDGFAKSHQRAQLEAEKDIDYDVDESKYFVRQPSIVENDDFQTAQDHQSDGGNGGESMDVEGSQLGGGGQGFIEEEGSVDNAPAQNPGQIAPVAGAGGGAMGGAAARQVTHFSDEAPRREFVPAEWSTKRSDRIRGQYWKTFGERKKALRGGVSGFFKALFGRGMARANRAAEKRAFIQEPIERARAWRKKRRADGSEAVPEKSALKTRLAGETIENLSTFPREPGVIYDEQVAKAAHAGFMQARAQHRDASEGGSQDMFASYIESPVGRAERAMKDAHAAYDMTVGNQTLFQANPNWYDARYQALVDANRRAGAAFFADRGLQHRKPQKVRFKDGAEDEDGLPVNDPTAGPENKPMPTSVRFFPAPIGRRTFERDARASSLTQLNGTPEYHKLVPEKKAERRRALREELMGPAEKYVESLGDIGHPDEISDEQALKNERFAWPVRARMMRMEKMNRYVEMGRHEKTAMNLAYQAQRDETDPLDSDEFRDHFLRAQIGGQADRDLEEEKENHRAQRFMRRTDTTKLGSDMKMAAGDIMRSLGVDIDPNVDLAEQVPRLPRNFFDYHLKQGELVAREAANDGGGGGALIEEEDP